MRERPVVGWIGTGRMGRPLAGFVLAAGYPLVVWSRRESSRRMLVERGAREAPDPCAVAHAAEVVFTSLPDDAAVRSTLLGDAGLLARAGAGTILAETSTISTALSDEIALEAERRGIPYLRMPISGNAASAEHGDVTVLVSGPESAWQAVRPVVESFSTAQVYVGDGDEARVLKLVVNAIVVTTAQSLAEALTLGRKAGLGWRAMLDALAESTIASPWLKAKARLLRERDFTPTMTTTLILKDMDLVLGAARAHGVPMPLAATTRELLQTLVDAGYGDADYLSSVKLSERQAGLPPDPADRG